MDDLEPSFLMAYPENGKPFIIYPYEIISGKLKNSKKIMSYTVISSKDMDRISDDDLNRAVYDQMDALMQMRTHFKPIASVYNRYLSAIPSRGDLRHLLAQLPGTGSVERDTVKSRLSAFQMGKPLNGSSPPAKGGWEVVRNDDQGRRNG